MASNALLKLTLSADDIRLRLGIPNIVSTRIYLVRQHEFLPMLNKCRDNVMAWMGVNKQWKDRCTAEKVTKFKGKQLLEEADLVFNNPAVVLEIGLLDVFRFLVERKKIDMNAMIWANF